MDVLNVANFWKPHHSDIGQSRSEAEDNKQPEGINVDSSMETRAL